MKHLKRLTLAGVMLLATCGLTGSAEATQITPVNTVVTFHSTVTFIAVHGGGDAQCPTATITGRTPAAPSTWQTIPVTLTFATTCVSFNTPHPTVEVAEGCHTNGGTPLMHVMGVGANTAVWTMTLPATCNIRVNLPLFSCAWTVPGGQTIGNGTTSASGGGLITGGPTGTIDPRNALIPDLIVDNPTLSSGCPSSGTYTGTMTGRFHTSTTFDIDGA